MDSSFNRRRFVRAVPLTAASAALLAAGKCPSPVAAEHEEMPAGEPAADQTLRMVSRDLPRTLGPQQGSVRPMLQNTFLSAFITDKEHQLAPGVCTDWTVSSDGLTYTLKVDPLAKFSDGSKITAADLKFSYEYLTWPETESWAPPYVTRPILGYQEVVDGKTKEMAGLIVVDDQTLQVTLAEPFGPFIYMLSIHLAGIVKQDNVVQGGETWDDAPACCGPYKVESWNRDTAEIVWVPNEQWWRTPPAIQRVTNQRVEDANTHAIMWENDEMDFFRPTDALAVQLQQGPFASQLHLNPYSGTYLFYPKLQRAPMEDVNVRRALLKATDMGTIIEAVFMGGRTPAYSVYPAGLDGYMPPKPYYDAEGAREALAASTYGNAANLPPITIAMPSEDLDLVQIAEAMTQMWQDTLGISARVELTDAATDPAQQTAQLFRTAQTALIPDPASFGTDLGSSSGIFMHDLMEAAPDTDGELDALVSQANRLPVDQQEERIALYQQIERMIMERAYYIPMFEVAVYYAVKPWVINLETNSDLSPYTITEVYIAEHQ